MGKKMQGKTCLMCQWLHATSISQLLYQPGWIVEVTTGETAYFLTRKETLRICQKKKLHFKIQKECRVPAACKRSENTTVLSILYISYFSH